MQKCRYMPVWRGSITCRAALAVNQNHEPEPIAGSKCSANRLLLQVAPLRDSFSEFALIKYRMLVEVRWLQALAANPSIPEVPPFSPEATEILEGLCEDNFTLEVAQEVKDVERVRRRVLDAGSCASQTHSMLATCTRVLTALQQRCQPHSRVHAQHA